MAENLTLARPYANALFEVAKADDRLAEWSAALESASRAVADDAVAELLSSPALSDDERVGLVADLARRIGGESKAFDDEHGRNFLRLLAENDRLYVLPEIREIFDELKAEAENTIDVELTAAAPVDADIEGRIREALERRLGRRVELRTSIDESLIGGAVIRADDLVIDGSLRTRLGKLARALIQ
jgi:F-type H+-transporting ATPase subunit delta